MKKTLLLIVFLLSGFLFAQGQYFSTGQDPASVKWKQIRTRDFRIIYPSAFEKTSQYMANILKMVTRQETKTLSARVPRIPILIHSQSVVSNGLTVWAPRRIELYPCPPQNSYAEEWLEQLVIHEYRHAVQISKMNQGFSRILYYIFGEQITGGILGLYVPSWFLEGDATATETALSNSGRGRTAVFENVLRAQLLGKGIYPYDKAVLGSYWDFVPDAYQLGYPLVTQARKTYGTDIWNVALDRTAKYPFMIVPFSSGIRKVSGLTKTRFYHKILSDLTDQWQKQDVKVDCSPIRYITSPKTKFYTSYVHPVLNNDSIIITEKETLDDVDWIISINRHTGKERKLIPLGYSFEESISTSGDYFTWSEWEPDPRWQNRDYSVIRLYNMRTRQDQYLTHRSRYFAPSLSPGADAIAAVRTDTENHSFIDLLDVHSGEVTRSFPMKNHDLAMTPNWSLDAGAIIFTLLTERGKTLAKLDLQTGNITHYLPFSFMEISGPAYYHMQHIIFSADYSGISNLYAVDTLTLKIYQVVSSRFSCSDPDFTSARDTMIFLDYTPDGFKIAETAIDTLKWIPLEEIRDASIHLYDSIVKQENANIQDSALNRGLYKILQDSVPDSSSLNPNISIYETSKYSKFLNLFKPHSWAPASIDINSLSVHPGISILSQNLLSTTFATAGYDYDINERTGKFYVDLTYKGWYPVFDFRFDFGKRAALFKGTRYTYNEMNFKAIVSQPLNFSHGRVLQFFQPSIGTTLISLLADPTTPAGFPKHTIQRMDYRLYFSRTIKSDAKDMYPRWGQIFDGNFRNTPFDGKTMGSILSAEGNFYFPGFFRHHGFWLYAGYQQKERKKSNAYDFSDLISYPRGFSGQENHKLCSFFINYKFPLFYPDFSAGSVAYFKRFKLNLFFDYSEGKTGTRYDHYRSTGAELTADLHLLRFVFPFELGVRGLYFPDTSALGFEFIYSVNF